MTKQELQNHFQEGDKVQWEAIVRGEKTLLRGDIAAKLTPETLRCIGQTPAGEWLRDDEVSIYDPTLQKL